MSEDVLEEGVLLGEIPSLKYQDYNLLDPEKFPQFQENRYMCRRIDSVTNVEVLEPQEWIEKLAPSGLLNLLRIPHFVRSSELNAVVKVLLSCMHDGYLWLDRKIDVNEDIIHRIIGLSKVGADPASHFVGKNLDRKPGAKLTKPFKLTKGDRAYDVMDIEDEALWFTIQLLVGCVLRKCRPTEVLATAVELVASAKDGKPYNWCLYLLNQFMGNYPGVQEHN